MGRISLPCNMEESEAAAYLNEFDIWLTDSEEKLISALFEQYLFYETWGRKNYRDFICTHQDCGHFIFEKDERPEIFKYNHGDTCTCPRCGQRVTLISMGKMRSFATLAQDIRIVLCRVGSNGALLLTAGWARKKYSWDDLCPTVWFNEKVRICLLPGKRMEWRKHREWNGWTYVDAGWHIEDFVKEPFNPYMHKSDGSYYFVCPEVLQDTAFKYCQLEEWHDQNTHADMIEMQQPVRQVVKYLSRYTQHPAMEMAVKLGMFQAVTDLVLDGKKNSAVLDWSATTIAGFLRVEKPEAKLFLKNQYDLNILQEYQKAKKNKTVNELGEFIHIVDDSGGPKNMPMLVDCARKAGCSLRQASNYVVKRAKPKDRGQMLTTWRDYLDMASKLKYDLSQKDVSMPKDLQRRHDAAAETVRAIEETEQGEKYQKRVKQLRKLYEFQMDDLCILVPVSSQEIVREGQALRHCVAGYAARHVNGKLDILFLRHVGSKATPMVTIEMDPRTSPASKILMRQIHGYRNDVEPGAVPPKLAYKDFLEVWQDWMRQGSPRDRKGNPIVNHKKEKTA